MFMISKPKYDFQTRINAEASTMDRICFSAYYGSGKTYLSMQWLENLYYRHKKVFPVLVLCPKNLITQWCKEIRKHSTFEPIAIKDASAAKRALKLCKPVKEVQIFVINYDAYRSKPVRSVLFNRQWMTLIVDESTALKETRTQRWQMLYKTCNFKSIPYRAFLTGRLITEDVAGAYGQLYFLDDGETFGKNFMKFRHTYQMPGPPWKPYDWTFKPDGAKQLAARLVKHCVFVSKKELDAELPPVEKQRIMFDWPPALLKKYKILKKDFELELDDGTIWDTKWAIGKAQKMHQLCQGFAYIDKVVGKKEDGKDLIEREIHNFHTLKCDWLKTNLPFILKRGPILIWSHYTYPLFQFKRMIEQDLELTVSIISGGGLTDKQNDQAEEDFKSGKTDIILLSQMKAARGLDFWRAASAIFTSRCFSVEYNENAARRCLRSGSEIHDKILYINLLMEDSTDLVVLDALTHKLNISEEVLKHVQS